MRPAIDAEKGLAIY